MIQPQDPVSQKIHESSHFLGHVAAIAQVPIVIAHHPSISEPCQVAPVMEVRPDCKAVVCAYAVKDADQAQRFIDCLNKFFAQEKVRGTLETN